MTEPLCTRKRISITNTFHLLDNNLKMIFTSICLLYVTGRSPVQRTPTECGVSECDLETSMMKRLRPTTVVELGRGEG